MRGSKFYSNKLLPERGHNSSITISTFFQLEHELYLLVQRLAAKISIYIHDHKKSGQYLYIQVPKTWRSIDHMKIGSSLLMLKEKDL
ncbi:hypothetical protein NC651_027918 [Populus alba x Populus x berolinensis]|nr:hypothetical protein NC651_027918 [Populus alba x Populus x berolinensis]